MSSTLDSMYNQVVNDTILKTTEERLLIDPKLENSIHQLRKAMVETFEPNKLKNQSKYRAICLGQLPSTTENDKTKIRIKARIPELHTLLPLPVNDTDYARIASYPTFVGQDLFHPNNNTAVDDIPVGSEVEVSFGDNINFTQPRLERVISIMTSQRLENTPPSKNSPKKWQTTKTAESWRWRF